MLNVIPGVAPKNPERVYAGLAIGFLVVGTIVFLSSGWNDAVLFSGLGAVASAFRSISLTRQQRSGDPWATEGRYRFAGLAVVWTGLAVTDFVRGATTAGFIFLALAAVYAVRLVQHIREERS